jgi:hypothetical protein
MLRGCLTLLVMMSIAFGASADGIYNPIGAGGGLPVLLTDQNGVLLTNSSGALLTR